MKTMKTPALARLDLHKLLDSDSYDHAVILTYTFDPIFFEEYCLANLNGFHTCKSISVCLDRTTYNKIIGGSQTGRPKQANLRYLLHPITVPGVFHPKLILLTSSNKGRLLVGSANFTRPGLTANAELVAAYDFKIKEKESYAPIFRSAFGLVKAIADRWPARNLTSSLQEMLRDSPWLEEHEDKCETVELIANLETPLLTQLISKVSGTIECVSIVSRYFDESPIILDKLLAQTAARKIKIFTQNCCTTLPSTWLKHPAVREGTVEIYLSDYSSEEHEQSLHGKAVVLHTSSGALFAFGSANCTSPALLHCARHANVELLVTVPLAARDAKVLTPRLLDPSSNAERLIKASQLVSTPIERDEGYDEKFPVEIIEAEADKGQILVWLVQPLNQSELRAKLDFSGGRFVRLPVKDVHRSELGISIDEEISRRLGQTPAVISFENRDGTPQSNQMLVTNLLDVQTGMNARKARYVKEAEQNTAGLLSVLLDLRSGSDEDALRTFLTFCDIPLTLGSRPGWRPLIKPGGASRDGMRSLGQQDFKIALTLHDLALSFCERHFRKLRRHASERSPDGIPNFLHIALAIGGVLESQINRALSGLEARDQVTIEEWAAFRNICDTYFLHYRELTTLVWAAYLSKLIREFPAKRIREAFDPELQPLNDLAQQMLHFRERVEKLRTTKCVMEREHKSIPFGYFQSVFSEERWPKVAGEVKATRALIIAAITGEAPLANRALAGRSG
jgi:HKD family nuclease